MWNKILTYLYIRKNDEKAPNFNIKMMHKINRISLLMFAFAVVVMLMRLFTR